MTTTITADLFQALNNKSDSEISNTNAEYIIDQAIDRLNTYGAELTNLSGSAGSKSVSVTSAQAGAILEVARLIFYGYYKGQENLAPPGAPSLTMPNMLTAPSVEEQIKQLAFQLKGRSFLRT